MQKCVICGKDTLNPKLCGDKRCAQINRNNNGRKRYAGLTTEQRAIERKRNVVPQTIFSQKVMCKCPRCGKDHKYTFPYGWIGKGTPYKYCDACYAYMMYTHNDIQATALNIPRQHAAQA